MEKVSGGQEFGRAELPRNPKGSRRAGGGTRTRIGETHRILSPAPVPIRLRPRRCIVPGDGDSAAETITTVASAGNLGRYSLMVLNGSGDPVIAYQDATKLWLKVAVVAPG